MPSEVGQILLPYNKKHADLLPIIDGMMRNKRSIEEILTITNKTILKESFGFSNAEIGIANSIRKKLSARRLNRGKPNRKTI